MLYNNILKLHWLFRVRFHYGHPDVFDRIFHITRGGISKASRGINLSEDIFAGRTLDNNNKNHETEFFLTIIGARKFVFIWNNFGLFRFQLNPETREYNSPRVYSGWKGSRCWAQPNLFIWSKSGLWKWRTDTKQGHLSIRAPLWLLPHAVVLFYNSRILHQLSGKVY